MEKLEEEIITEMVFSDKNLGYSDEIIHEIFSRFGKETIEKIAQDMRIPFKTICEIIYQNWAKLRIIQAKESYKNMEKVIEVNKEILEGPNLSATLKNKSEQIIRYSEKLKNEIEKKYVN